MGPHLSPLADLIGPSTVKPTERSGSTLADLRSNPSSREGFDSYLKRARSAGESAPVEGGEEPVSTEEHQDADLESDTNAGTSEPAVTVHSKSAMSVETIGQTPSTSVAPVSGHVEMVNGTAAESNGETPVKPGSSGSDIARLSAPIASLSQADAEAKIGQAAHLSTTESAAIIESDARTQAASRSGQLTALVGEGDTGAAKSMTSSDSQPSASKAAVDAKHDGHAIANTNTKSDVSSGTRRDSALASTTGSIQAETGTPSEAGREASCDDGRPQQKQGQRESFFDMKIKDSIESQRTGTSAERTVDSSSSEGNATQQNTTGNTSGKTQPTLTSLDDLRDIKTVSIRQSSGDAGATSIAKLLLSGSGLSQLSSVDTAGITSLQTASGPEGGGTFSPPSITVAGTASSTPSVSGMSASGLLASGMEATDSLSETADVLRAAGRGGRQQATLKLDPPELGQVRVQVQMRNQDMRVQITAETQVAGKMLESRISELRDSLAVQGIRLERAEVIVRSPGTGEPGQQHQNDHRHANGGREQWQAGESNDGFAQGERAFTNQDDTSMESGVSGMPQEEMVGGIEPGAGEEAGILNTMSMAELSVDLVA